MRAAVRGETREAPRPRVLTAAVVVGALGYFVDIYDLLLFSIVRVPSLRGLGVAEAEMLDVGVLLLNAQMTGLLLGGVVWGVLGDRRGRVSVLLGSIALYSTANLLNAAVTEVWQYAVLRFVAGVGLAGELGAAITLVAETLPKETRGYGTAIVASFGILGAVAAALVGGLTDWRVAYVIGGLLGFALLGARLKLHESGMFRSAARGDARRGDLLLLLGSRRRAARYAWCVLVGLPIWYAIGILVTFSPEVGAALGVRGALSAGTAVLFCYLGLSAGDLASGVLSQRMRSRVLAMVTFIGLTSAAVLAMLFSRGLSPAAFYALCAALGFGTGYWAVFVTNAAEQFGTNLRATAATTTPNVIRGSVVPVTLAFQALVPRLGVRDAALWVGVACILVALWAARSLDETFGRDLDYVES